MATLAEIRAKLLAQEKSKGGAGTRDNAIYPHWNIPDNSTTTLRFLPDGNPSNDFFWLERQMIKIPFSGIAGSDESKPVIVQVPCVEMWGDNCPVHAEIRPWFKDPSMEATARKYWKKRSYLFQGFVVDGSLTEDDVPENIIRRFTISPQIYKIIQSALMDPDFGDEMPTDYERGVDFKVTKTQQGTYADYNTSKWARKERGLTQIERDAIEKHGLFDLNDFMPKKPSAAELNAIYELFEASVEGQLYDPERFADFYRPFGLDKPKQIGSHNEHAADNAEPAATETKASVATQPAATETKVKDAKDILAAIRARKEA